MATFYLQLSLRGGHVGIIEACARERGVDLLAVDGLALSELKPEDKGTREKSTTYLFRRQAMTVQGAMVRVKHYVLMDAKERIRLQTWLSSPGITHEEPESVSDWPRYLTEPN